MYIHASKIHLNISPAFICNGFCKISGRSEGVTNTNTKGGWWFCSQNNIEKHPHIDYKQGSLRSILAGMVGLPYISPVCCKYRSFESILGWVVILLSQSYWKASSPILIKNKVSLNRSWLGWCLFLSNILKWKIIPRRSIVNR